MPKFPDRNSLSDAGSLRSGRHYVTASEVDTSAKYRGIAQIGAALQGLSGDFAAKQNEENALDLLKAEAAQRRGLSNLDRTLDTDPDYGSHESKFLAGAGDVTNQASNLIRDPKMREKWKLRADLETETERERVVTRADRYQKEQRKSELDTTLQQYQNDYTSPSATPEQRLRARKSIEEGIDLGERSGILRPFEARKLRQERLQLLDQTDIERRLNEDPEQLLRDLTTSGVDRKAPGLVTPGTIDTSKIAVTKDDQGRPVLPDIIRAEIAGKQWLLPGTNAEGKALSEEEAVKQFEQTGQHFGSFDTPENADRFAKGIGNRLSRRGSSIGKAMISAQLETGQTDPLIGVSNISPDSDGTKSYGNFGLNSGGSIQRFIAEYGKDGNVEMPTAKPGTAKFDRQWKAITSANPEMMHALEMQWYEEKILPQISGDLTKQGVPDNIANDSRVQAYIADRMIQYGPNSTSVYSRRIRQAAEDAGGDPVQFLRHMSEQDSANLETDFRTFLGTVPKSQAGRARALQGLGNRVSGRERLALGTPENDQPGGMYPTLTPLQRSDYVAKARSKIKSNAESARSQYKQMLDDDISSRRNTGQPLQSFDYEGARAVLDKSQISHWEVESAAADLEYKSMHDLDTLTEPQLRERLRSLEPQPGEPWFAVKQKIYDKVERKVETGEDSILRLRNSDPARAVSSLPDVKTANENAVASANNPEAVQEAVRVRLDAQKRVGIPENIQSPISLQEARNLASRVKGLSGKPLIEALTPIQEELQTTYGPYAHAVGSAMVDAIVRDRELAERVQGIIDKTFKGMPVSASQVRATEILNEGRLAIQAFGGAAVGDPLRQYGMSGDEGGYTSLQESPFRYYGLNPPPLRARLMLQQNRALAPDFDAKYGRGAAAWSLNTPIPEQDAQPK